MLREKPETAAQPAWPNYSAWMRSQRKLVSAFREVSAGPVRLAQIYQTAAFPDPATPDVTLSLLRHVAASSSEHRLNLGTGTFTCRPRASAYVLAPAHTPAFIEGRGPYEILCLCIPQAEIDRLLDEASLATVHDFGHLHTRLLNDVAIERIMLLLLGDAENGAPHGELFAEGLTTALVARLLELAKLPPLSAGRLPTLSPRALSHVSEYMQAHLGEKVALAQLARMAGLSRFHFGRVYKTTTGETPCETLTRLRLERARQLIGAGKRELSLAQIAADCGFADQSHLTRHFRRAFGETPHRMQPVPPPAD